MSTIPLTIRTQGTQQEFEVNIEATATIGKLKLAIQEQTRIPSEDQRLIYAGTQLDEVVTEAWLKKKQSTDSALAVATNANQLAVGDPLTLEHYGLQKKSTITVFQKQRPQAAAAAAAPPAQLQHSQAPEVQWQQPQSAPADRRPGADVSGSGGYSAGNSTRPEAQADEQLYRQLSMLSDHRLHGIISRLLNERQTLKDTLLKLPGSEHRSQHIPQQRQAPQHGGGLDFRDGNPVKVYSNSSQTWFDGIVQTVAERTSPDGKIPAGAIQVQFNGSSKWVAPGDVQRILRHR